LKILASMLVSWVPSVCWIVCLSPAGHNSTANFTYRYRHLSGKNYQFLRNIGQSSTEIWDKVQKLWCFWNMDVGFTNTLRYLGTVPDKV